MVGGLSTATELEKMLGRKLGYLEYLSFIFYANTGGEASYGTQILYEKNNRIVKHEASSAPIFKPGYDYDKPERNLRFGCMKYNRLYFTLTRNTGNWLHDNNIIYFEK